MSTVYYPELSPETAMKIGGEYSSAKVTPQNLEKLVEEAGLTKPLVWRRVPELADAILSTLPNLEIQNPIAESVVALIKKARGKNPYKFPLLIANLRSHGTNLPQDLLANSSRRN